MQCGEGGRAALLLPSEAAGRGELPHVPRGIWYASDGAGSQAAVECGRNAEDREITAPGDRLRDADCTGDGDLYEHGWSDRHAEVGAGISADQSPAGLPDLRSGR